MTINIVGTTGPDAFAPNPLQAAMGHTIVWTNHDATVHQIVLDDGTSVGTIAPGQSSAPITVSAAALTYRCTLHPSMVGTIQDPSVASPIPMPEPDPGDGYY
jgi:plastocyanin